MLLPRPLLRKEARNEIQVAVKSDYNTNDPCFCPVLCIQSEALAFNEAAAAGWRTGGRSGYSREGAARAGGVFLW